MIRVRQAPLHEAETEGILIPVSEHLEAVTPAGRRVEVQAGPSVAERLRALGDVAVGGAVVTPAGRLAASLLIQVVIESLDEAMSEAGIRQALTNGLRHASEWGLRSLALPLLGTGAGRWDAEMAARIVLPVLRDHLNRVGQPEEVVVMVSGGYERAAVLEELARLELRPAGDED